MSDGIDLLDFGRITTLMEEQMRFQNMCGIDLETMDEAEAYKAAEVYIFKAIEELIELRKTFPSSMNRFAKNQIRASNEEMLGELSDTFMFLINFMLAMRIKPEALLDSLESVQFNNFTKLREKLEKQGVE